MSATTYNTDNLSLNDNLDYNIKPKFILDSGASEHYSFNKDWFINYKPINNKSIKIANGHILQVKGQGDIPIKIKYNNSYKELIITGVYFVPEIKATLLSSKELANKGWEILFKQEIAMLSHPKYGLDIKANWANNAYYLNILINYDLLEPILYSVLDKSEAYNKTDLIHQRLNHLNHDLLKKTLENTIGFSPDKLESKLNNCDSCYKGKFHEIGSKTPMSRAPNLTVFDIDIAGPLLPLGLNGERFFMTIICRGSRAVWIYPIKHKGDAFDVITKFFNLINTQFNTKIKALKLDNAKEFKSNKWTIFCNNHGTICEYTSPYSASQNGIAEILNKYVIERLITICQFNNIPLFLWPILIQSIIHIKNRTYNPVINKTPYEALANKKPYISYIKTLGSLTYTLIPKEKRPNGKINIKANSGILIGFNLSNNFIVYIPSENKIIDTKNLIIKENLKYKADNIENSESDDYSSLIKYLEIDDFNSNKTN